MSETSKKFLFGGLACMTAAAVTNPIDVLKVRLQLQGELAANVPKKYTGFLQGLIYIVREEGVLALYKGLTPSLLREGTYSTIRMGMYEPVKSVLQGSGKSGGEMELWKKVVAGACSGCIGAAIANPTDLIKVRMQAELRSPQPRYKGTLDAFVSIFKSEGFPGLYRGVGPTTQRAMLLTASQLASYDEAKYLLLKTGWFSEGVKTHLVASMIAGLVCATTTSPIDLVKSRYMNQKFGPDGRGLVYSSTLDCFKKTITSEGVGAVYKGFFPNWLRIGPHTIVTFIVLEYLRRLSGMKPV